MTRKNRATRKATIGQAEQLPATEVVMIETKIGSTFSVAQMQTRVVAGQSFIGGNSMTEAGEFDGNRIWVPIGDVTRMTEYETVARFLMKDKIESAMKHCRQLQQHLRSLPAGSERGERIKKEIKSLDDLISGKKTESATDLLRVLTIADYRAGY
jgi:hypothetical protein